MQNENVLKMNRIKAQTVIKGINSRNMHGYFAETKEDALKLALELIPEGSSVGYGGSVSADEIGIKEALSAGNYKLIRREEAKSPQEMHDKYREIFDADFFLSSANAMTEDGIIVNIDGNANRVSAIAFGPKKVLFIVGMNKIAKDLDSAVKRARTVAAPANAQRFDIKTPCKELGTCMNCKAKDCICSEVLITRFQSDPERVHVILVNEELGF